LLAPRQQKRFSQANSQPHNRIRSPDGVIQIKANDSMFATSMREPERKARPVVLALGREPWRHRELEKHVDLANNTVSFFRKKTGVPGLVHLGAEALNLFKDYNHRRPQIHRQQFWLHVAL
jgi:hypothetical protein